MSLAASYPCPVCGAEERAQFKMYYDGPQKLYRCEGCGFVGEYAGPGAPVTVLNYEEELVQSLPSSDVWLYPGRERALVDIAERIQSVGGRGRLLDVGCGDGHFLTICRSKGFKCHGVEPSRALADRTAMRGFEVTRVYYDSGMFAADSFDVIVFIKRLSMCRFPARRSTRPEST